MGVKKKPGMIDNFVKYKIEPSFGKTIIKAFINDGEYVGWLVLWNDRSSQVEGNFMPIHSGNILPNYRRQGFYSSLIQEGARVAKERGYDGIVSTPYDEMDSSKERSDSATHFWEMVVDRYTNIEYDSFSECYKVYAK